MIVARCLPNINKEIIIVDDYSTDGTREWLKVNFPEGQRHASTVGLDDDGNLIFAEVPGYITGHYPCHLSRTQQGQGRSTANWFRAASPEISLSFRTPISRYDPNDWAQMYDLIAVRRRPHRSLYFITILPIA